eukprot:CAMPEP_0114146802 /NCGR_PEP_ID=MMETSP0043_2-20121206/20759_1 /TAXON_ID=464988 /ORGANISM="Hemiselmis andersenii, Strain CCMP644" /LENGTH=427 /DNA_ID=CAMNT_0001241281 /DNA_START=28 /DNA_END=1311 /DNA_ORIENTATION=-
MDSVTKTHALGGDTPAHRDETYDCDGAAAGAPELSDEMALRIAQLSDPNHSIAAFAAQYLFERSHTSNPRAAENKDRIGRSGAILRICRLMESEQEAARFQACSALSELAFCHEANCRAIISTPGCLEAVVTLLQPDNGTSQCDAALIVNNCAAFCTDTCASIVHYPGMLAALQALATGGNTSSKNVAVGALNSLTRCPSAGVRLAMLSAGVVEDTLSAVLAEEGQGDLYEARIARAAMGIANLQGEDEDAALGDGPNFTSAMATICKIMRFALQEKSWAGIFFAPYSVCLPLNKLSRCEEHRHRLVSHGLVELMSELLATWKPSHQSNSTLLLALAISHQLLVEPDCDDQRDRAEQCGLLDNVVKTAEGARGENADAVAAAEAIVSGLRERHQAVWMSQSARVGEGSMMHQLDDNVMELISRLAHV